MLETSTREVVNLTLMHESNKVREFYSALPRPALITPTRRIGTETRWWLRGSAHGRSNGEFRTNDPGRHGPRCARYLALPLPHQRPYVGGNDGAPCGSHAKLGEIWGPEPSSLPDKLAPTRGTIQRPIGRYFLAQSTGMACGWLASSTEPPCAGGRS